MHWPDCRCNGELIEYCMTAPAGEVQEYLLLLRESVRWVEKVVDARAGRCVGEMVNRCVEDAPP